MVRGVGGLRHTRVIGGFLWCTVCPGSPNTHSIGGSPWGVRGPCDAYRIGGFLWGVWGPHDTHITGGFP